MKTVVTPLIALFLFAPCVQAAGVKLERLEDFDPQKHAFNVNVEAVSGPGCAIDGDEIQSQIESLLTRSGFRIAKYSKSHLEFAVSIKGQAASGPEPCGVLFLSMVRQIPRIKMLRVSPGSTSTEFRLWTVEHILTCRPSSLHASLMEEARKDVVAFVREFKKGM